MAVTLPAPARLSAADAAARRRRRLPLVALAVAIGLAGLWGGLIRLGLVPETALATAGDQHGPLLALGFLGTLISLERAVALDRGWAYAAPLATGAGAVAVLAGAPTELGPALTVLGGLVLVGAHVAIDRIQRSVHNVVMGLGALSWCAAAAMWLADADVSRFAPLMAGFLVATIVGERLELTRAAGRTAAQRRLLVATVAVLTVGLAISIVATRTGMRIAGAGMLGQGLWLLRHDLARRTVRIAGVTRYIALALLSGYAWLVCGGALWLALAPLADGPAYDAALHAVFLGFVASMVLAHAPVIVPAVLRVPFPFHRRMYAPLALLQASLLVRLAGGDLAGSGALWRWGGAVNVLALLLFGAAVAVGIRQPAGHV
ncbi:MAG: hypothetical protein ACRDL5_01040 [Solirubrobacteraceae bacterium]